MIGKLNLNGKSKKELLKLQSDIEREIGIRDRNRKKDARRAAESAAKKHGFTLSELMGAVAPKAGKPAKSARRKRQPVPAKYRNPADTTQTWNGMGRKPGWFVSQIENGATPDDLAIE